MNVFAIAGYVLLVRCLSAQGPHLRRAVPRWIVAMWTPCSRHLMTDMLGKCIEYAETMRHASLPRVQGSGKEGKPHRHTRPCPV